MKGLRLSAGRLEERGMKVGIGERERREKVKVYTPLHKDAFVQQPACALPQNYEFLLTFFSLFNVSDFAKKYNNVQNSFKQTTICLKTL